MADDNLPEDESEFYIQSGGARHEGTYTWLCSIDTTTGFHRRTDGLTDADEERFKAAGIKSNRLAGFGSPKRQRQKIVRAVAELREFEVKQKAVEERERKVEKLPPRQRELYREIESTERGVIYIRRYSNFGRTAEALQKKGLIHCIEPDFSRLYQDGWAIVPIV